MCLLIDVIFLNCFFLCICRKIMCWCFIDNIASVSFRRFIASFRGRCMKLFWNVNEFNFLFVFVCMRCNMMCCIEGVFEILFDVFCVFVSCCFFVRVVVRVGVSFSFFRIVFFVVIDDLFNGVVFVVMMYFLLCILSMKFFMIVLFLLFRCVVYFFLKYD